MTLPLPPIAVADVPWWRDDVRPGLPRVRADSLLERWPRGRIELAARYDTAFGGTFATLALRDSVARHEWRIGRVQTPIHHVHWLDRPALDSISRRSLSRAFNEAVFYDEDVRTADLGGRLRTADCGSTAACAVLVHTVGKRRSSARAVPKVRIRSPQSAVRRRRTARI